MGTGDKNYIMTRKLHITNEHVFIASAEWTSYSSMGSTHACIPLSVEGPCY